MSYITGTCSAACDFTMDLENLGYIYITYWDIAISFTYKPEKITEDTLRFFERGRKNRIQIISEYLSNAKLPTQLEWNSENIWIFRRIFWNISERGKQE